MTAREQATILHELGLRVWVELWYENPRDVLAAQRRA